MLAGKNLRLKTDSLLLRGSLGCPLLFRQLYILGSISMSRWLAFAWVSLISTIVVTVCASETSWAWGERGHDHVAIVAARLAEQELGPKSSFTRILREKEAMLAHLANVPDIVWKQLDQATFESNSNTHFIDLEYLATKPSFATVPRSFKDMTVAVQNFCKTNNNNERDKICSELASRRHEAVAKAGSAHLRMKQLQLMMLSALQTAAQAKDKTTKIDAVNEALTVGGIMGHFAGDLAQPMHTSSDYDGYDSGHGGLHVYFEGNLVDAQDLQLIAQVYKAALPRRELRRIRAAVPQELRANTEDFGMLLAEAEAFDSHQQMDRLRALDKKFALIKPSSNERGMRIPAERKDAALAAAGFKPLIVERLSVGAQVLAELWVQTYKLAGSPDLSEFKSYFYPVAPKFIPPVYVTDFPL